MTALSSVSEKQELWVIDSRASDHITGCESFFSSYAPSFNTFKVRMADGWLSTVVGTGTIKISPKIVQENVRPKLSCNLLSLSKITKDLNLLSCSGHNLSCCSLEEGVGSTN